MYREVIKPRTVAKPGAPYANAIKVRGFGSLIFIAGVLPNDIDGNIVCKGDIVGQTRQVVKNLIATLEAAGANPGNVVKTTTYVVESAMVDFQKTSASIDCLSPFCTPTDTLVGVTRLACSEEGQLIEVNAIAVTE